MAWNRFVLQNSADTTKLRQLFPISENGFGGSRKSLKVTMGGEENKLVVRNDHTHSFSRQMSAVAIWNVDQINLLATIVVITVNHHICDNSHHKFRDIN